MEVFILLAAVALFLLGIAISHFFSGCETGFYRVSPMRLSILRQHGDRAAESIHRFLAHPERFVATTLVGNNIANYMITVAMGIAVSTMVAESSGMTEILATLLVTPGVFVFAELIPKSLYYRTPTRRLCRGARWFALSYLLFLPLTYPLMLVSRAIGRSQVARRQPLELVLSRTHLNAVLETGHREGLLTDMQAHLAENIMQVAREPVSLVMLPALTIAGTVDSASRDEILSMARRQQQSRILLHPEGKPYQWSSYVRIADLLRSGQSPRTVMTRIPEFEADAPKLVVLSELVSSYSSYGAIVEEGRVIGIVSRRTLLAGLQRLRVRGTAGSEPGHATALLVQ